MKDAFGKKLSVNDIILYSTSSSPAGTNYTVGLIKKFTNKGYSLQIEVIKSTRSSKGQLVNLNSENTIKLPIDLN